MGSVHNCNRTGDDRTENLAILRGDRCRVSMQRYCDLQSRRRIFRLYGFAKNEWRKWRWLRWTVWAISGCLGWTARDKGRANEDESEPGKTSKAPQKERGGDGDLFRDSMGKLQALGDKLTGVLEEMEKNQTQQLQLLTRFMKTFRQAMQSKEKD